MNNHCHRTVNASVRHDNIEHALLVGVDSAGKPLTMRLAEPVRAPLELCERVETLAMLLNADPKDGWASITALSGASPRFAPIIDRVNEKLAGEQTVEGDDE